MRKITYPALLLLTSLLLACGPRGGADAATVEPQEQEAKEIAQEERKPITIVVEKELTYDKYTLADTYPYKDTTRQFQWDKIREALRVVDSVQVDPASWGILRNRQNANGLAPLVKEWHRNEYKNVSDKWDVQRYQSVPLYTPGDSVPERYGRDGSWVRIVRADTTDRMRVAHIYNKGEWEVPVKYVKTIPDSVHKGFYKVVVVDRTNQNIASIEKVGDKWLVRSMNPATTGVHNPPYAHETPLGYFVVQEKKSKMIYTHDGSSEYAGYAPWASRFSNGGYLHGVPTNNVNAPIIEYSQTLGTTPRSHMCVRNASSHAKFLYDFAPVDQSLVIVIE